MTTECPSDISIGEAGDVSIGDLHCGVEEALICKETQDYHRALKIVNDAIDRVQNLEKSIQPDLHSTRCLIYCKLGLDREASEDMNMVRSTHREGEVVAERLAVHILLAQSKAKDALERFEKIDHKTRIDEILRREILQRLSRDDSLPLYERGEFEQRYNETLVVRPLFSEFDF